MDGFINVLKPPGLTSHDVVAFVRKILKEKKIGHTGTLDPGVAGVLPLCVGKATRLAEYITERGKKYRAEITLGRVTSTQDAYGEILAERSCDDLAYEDFSRTLKSFLGEGEQLPPMVSALRVGGVRLYDLARQGLEVERQGRKITIHEIEIIKEDWHGPNPRAIFDVVCSKGTYIRTLCHDVGEKLGTGAYLSFLIRTQSGPFLLENAWTLEEIKAQKDEGKGEFLIPLPAGISFMPKIFADEAMARDLSFGKTVLVSTEEDPIKDLNKNPIKDLNKDPNDENSIYQVLDGESRLLAVGRVLAHAGEPHRFFKPDKVFIS